ncbi:hypothetical protein [Aquimarina longa]|uniref:hypothetical protein n=1 Tax=Aquimarina longa TaxID=1080221 RepID=UPI000784FB66|nr:hypothetical protein [Aquimarina longa]
MSNWLDRVRPPKYLRYFFYIAYSWYRPYKSDRSDAHFNSVCFLAFANTIALISFVFMILGNFIVNSLGSKRIIITIIIFMTCIHYIYFFRKQKWKEYIKEFNYLKKKDRKRGALYLFLYFFIIIIILLPLSFYFIVKNSSNY